LNKYYSNIWNRAIMLQQLRNTSSVWRSMRAYERFKMSVRFSQAMRRNSADNFNLRRLRLGTMNAIQMDNTLYSVAEIFQQESFPRQGLEFAEFMLNRLGAEYASGSQVARQYTSDLYSMHSFLLSIYHEDLSFANLHQDELDRIERLLRRLTSLYHNLGVNSLKEPPSVTVLVTLARAYLELDNVCKTVDLLLWWTEESQADESELAPLFRETIKKCLSIGDEHITRELIDRMKALKAECGWTNFSYENNSEVPSTKEPKRTDEFESNEDFENMPPADNDLSRNNEIGILADKVIAFVTNASKEDRQQVCLYGNRLFNIHEIRSRDDVCTVFVDYYVRTENVKAATTWLQRLDQLSRSSDVFNKFEGVLGIFDKDPQLSRSPIRAVELFQRMESLESEGRGVLSTDMCNKLLRILANSKNEQSKSVLYEILGRLFIAAKKKNAIRVPNEDTYNILLMNKPSQAEVKKALTLFAMYWKRDLNAENQIQIIDMFIRQLSQHGMVEEAKNLMDLTAKANITLLNSTFAEYDKMLHKVGVESWGRGVISQDNSSTTDESSVRIIKELPGISTGVLEAISQEEKDAAIESVVNLLEIMSKNDDIEIPLNKLRHQLKFEFPQECKTKKNSTRWIFEALKSGKVIALKKPKEKEIKICLTKNREISISPYPPVDMDTSAEEEHLVLMANRNGGSLLRTEAIKILTQEFKSMETPYKRTKVLMNAYKNGTLYLRKAGCGHVIATTADQADAEIKTLQSISKKAVNFKKDIKT